MTLIELDKEMADAYATVELPSVDAAETHSDALASPAEMARPASGRITATGVSIVIPTLNEETTIVALLTRVDAVFAQLGVSYEVLVIDDDSTDRTVALAREAAAARQLPVRVRPKRGQRGKSFSLMEGFARARYPILGMIDADLQYPPEAFADMLHALIEADIVVGDRRATYETAAPTRGRLSGLFNDLVTHRIFGLDTDIQSGIKLFDRAVYTSLVLNPTEWSFDLDLLAQAKWAGYELASVPVEFSPRPAGKSKVRPLLVGLGLLYAALRLRLWLALPPMVLMLMRQGVLPQARRLPHDGVSPESEPAREDDEAHAGEFQQWLAQRAVSAEPSPHEHIARAFREQALQPAEEHAARAFSVLAPPQSARRSFTRGQVLLLTALALVWLIGLTLFATLTLALTMLLITLVYARNLVDLAHIGVRALSAVDEEVHRDEILTQLRQVEWPRYTILCPLYREAAVVPQFARAMQALDYPVECLQILLLTEEEDTATRSAIATLDLPPHFEVLIVPTGSPRTKPRACNFGLAHTTGEYVVIFDAEDIPDPRQLKKAVLAFAHGDRSMACAQAKLHFYNARQNLLTRLFAVEYMLWFELLMPGMQRAGRSLPLGGTSNHFPAALLRKLGGWDPYNVTEDCDLGLRLAQHRLHTVVLDSVTLEEANSNVRNWIRQRSRWIKGYLQTYLVHMRRPLRFLRRRQMREFFSLQFIIGGTPATFFINPLMWGMLGIYLLMRPLVEHAYALLYPGPLLYLGVICFVFGNYLCICLAMLACYRKREYRLMPWALALPVYWVMMSVAAVVALVQLIVKPHYWEKTVHGLHLVAPGAAISTLGDKDLAGEVTAQAR
jgi:cellulose synthase/poly-beta-1,6-N-acetylglucosamine synthase-like glycosyltransferase